MLNRVFYVVCLRNFTQRKKESKTQSCFCTFFDALRRVQILFFDKKSPQKVWLNPFFISPLRNTTVHYLNHGLRGLKDYTELY